MEGFLCTGRTNWTTSVLLQQSANQRKVVHQYRHGNRIRSLWSKPYAGRGTHNRVKTFPSEYQECYCPCPVSGFRGVISHRSDWDGNVEFITATGKVALADRAENMTSGQGCLPAIHHIVSKPNSPIDQLTTFYQRAAQMTRASAANRSGEMQGTAMKKITIAGGG